MVKPHTIKIDVPEVKRSKVKQPVKVDPKDTPSKKETIAQGREAIAMFVEGNAYRLEKWLDEIADQNPLAAFNAFMAVCEYHLPKQARVEHTGKDGKDLYPALSDEQMIERLQSLLLSAKAKPIDLKSETIVDAILIEDKNIQSNP